MIQFVAKLVNTFGIGLEQSGLAGYSGGGAISHEALAKRGHRQLLRTRNFNDSRPSLLMTLISGECMH